MLQPATMSSPTAAPTAASSRPFRWLTRPLWSGIGGHGGRQFHGLLDQPLDNLGFGNRGDDLAAYEDLALPVAGGHPEIGLARLARTVHDAAHHRNAERDVQAVERRRHFVGQFVDI